MRRILIAGAGYVGARLGALLAERGAEVLGVRRAPGAMPAGITPVVADLLDRSALARVSGAFDGLVFCAGPAESSASAYRSVYLDALSSVLDVLGERAERVLFTSSTAVYAQTDGGWVDETSPAEATHFSGATLLEAEAQLFARRPDAVVLRLGGVYGPGRSSLVRAIRRGEATLSPSDDRLVNRFHRDDCAGALAFLLEHPRPEPLYLGVDDRPASRREVLEWLAARLGVPPPRAGVPSAENARRGGSHKRCSNARLVGAGYVLRYPTYREGYAAVLAEESVSERG